MNENKTYKVIVEDSNLMKKKVDTKKLDICCSIFVTVFFVLSVFHIVLGFISLINIVTWYFIYDYKLDKLSLDSKNNTRSVSTTKNLLKGLIFLGIFMLFVGLRNMWQ